MPVWLAPPRGNEGSGVLTLAGGREQAMEKKRAKTVQSRDRLELFSLYFPRVIKGHIIRKGNWGWKRKGPFTKTGDCVNFKN
ncbi:MAG: hypothetical protein A2038_04605 [Deltaproteobacteria bacterium GWA2_57_13]|nr:MAG: hypothetical protein A2038_04605 [Deltaproteobacteria bacterium GWA2_57_13]